MDTTYASLNTDVHNGGVKLFFDGSPKRRREPPTYDSLRAIRNTRELGIHLWLVSHVQFAGGNGSESLPACFFSTVPILKGKVTMGKRHYTLQPTGTTGINNRVEAQ